MGRAKTRKIVLDGYGSYLKMDKGCFVVRSREGKEESYPALEMDLGEISLSEGNVVTTGALVYCGLWFVDVVVTTKFGEPIAMLKNFTDDSYVETRVCQYEALKNGKGLRLAKAFAIGKIEGQNTVLRKYGLKENPYVTRQIDSLLEKDLQVLRRRILHLEGKFSQEFFRQIYTMFPEKIRPLSRVSYLAFVGLNNVFNLTYTFLKWKCYRAIVKAHLEPYLGFLHDYLRPTRPNLVCDFMELYRYLIDDFLIENCRDLKPSDFYPKTVIIGDRKAKRMYLKDDLASDLVNNLHRYFVQKVKVHRIMRGESQEVETLINEEALLLARFLKDKTGNWTPRVAIPKAF
jgi:CRISPR-associated protein Cas1